MKGEIGKMYSLQKMGIIICSQSFEAGRISHLAFSFFRYHTWFFFALICTKLHLILLK